MCLITDHEAVVRIMMVLLYSWHAYPQDTQGHSSPAKYTRTSGVERQQRPAGPGPPQPSGALLQGAGLQAAM